MAFFANRRGLLALLSLLVPAVLVIPASCVPELPETRGTDAGAEDAAPSEGGARADADAGLADDGEAADAHDVLEPPLTPPTRIVTRDVTGLVTSTGNVYLTAEGTNLVNVHTAFVYRARKDNDAGSEWALYQEDTEGRFGEIAWAEVTPQYFWAYFIANYPVDGGVSSLIKRVYLGSDTPAGKAEIMATSPGDARGKNIVVDATNVYWADSTGIQTIPFTSGSVQTLTQSAAVGRIDVDAKDVYFAENNTIRRVAKSGGASSLVTTAGSKITALYVYKGPSTIVFWGEESGVVKHVEIGSGSVTPYVAPHAGWSITSVGFNGNNVMYIECPSSPGVDCALEETDGSTTKLVAKSPEAARLQWDSTFLIWSARDGVEKHVL